MMTSQIYLPLEPSTLAYQSISDIWHCWWTEGLM